jgi:hypothetical protein
VEGLAVTPFARRDPWWDLDGRGARRDRVQRRLVGFVVVVLSATLLALILAALPRVDARSIVLGPDRPVVAAAALADIGACLLIVLHQVRRARLG